MAAAGMPRPRSRATSASIATCEARTPAASARRRPRSSRMSYEARIALPPLIVTGRIGACGKTKRTPRSAGKRSAGTMSTKSLPSAPSPCIQTMLAAGAGAVSISMVSSRSATFNLSPTEGSRQRHRGARRLGEVEGLERRGGAPIASGQGLELEAPLDQLQHRGVVVLAMADEAALRVGRHDQRRHARAEPEAIDHRRAHANEPAAPPVAGDPHDPPPPG